MNIAVKVNRKEIVEVLKTIYEKRFNMETIIEDTLKNFDRIKKDASGSVLLVIEDDGFTTVGILENGSVEETIERLNIFRLDVLEKEVPLKLVQADKIINEFGSVLLEVAIKEVLRNIKGMVK